MYVCLCNKLSEYGILSWKHEEYTHDNKCYITFGVVDYVVHAGKTSDSRGRSIVQGMNMFYKENINNCKSWVLIFSFKYISFLSKNPCS